jgi:hypothetical protein
MSSRWPRLGESVIEVSQTRPRTITNRLALLGYSDQPNIDVAVQQITKDFGIEVWKPPPQLTISQTVRNGGNRRYELLVGRVERTSIAGFAKPLGKCRGHEVFRPVAFGIGGVGGGPWD